MEAKTLAAEEHKHTDLSSERIEAAISHDIEFLAAHPTRRKRERLYRNCLRAYPEQSLACLTEERAVRFGFCVP